MNKSALNNWLLRSGWVCLLVVGWGWSVMGMAVANSVLPESTRLMVKFNHPSWQSQKAALADEEDIINSRRLLAQNTWAVNVRGARAGVLAQKLRRRQGVETVEVDARAYALSVVNDPLVDDQWYMEQTGFTTAWQKTTGTNNVVVAVLDSGIDNDHPDISGKVNGWVNMTSSLTAGDVIGHGTHVAGIIGAKTNNGVGVAGAGYDTNLLSVKVLSDRGYGYYSWIIDGIYYAVDHGARVINLSLGGYQTSQLLEAAINYAWDKGVVIVAAAGNSNSSQKVYPAAYDPVIAVTAVDRNNHKAGFANYGSWVDLAAPGVEILSTLPNQPHQFSSSLEYGLASGTSMASPQVCALASLLWAMHPEWTNQQIRDKLETSTDVIGAENNLGQGVINAARAVDVVIIPEPSAIPAPVPQETFSPTPTPTPVAVPAPAELPSPSPTQTLTPTTPSPSPSSNPTSTRRDAIRGLLESRWCRIWPERCH